MELDIFTRKNNFKKFVKRNKNGSIYSNYYITTIIMLLVNENSDPTFIGGLGLICV